MGRAQGGEAPAASGARVCKARRASNTGRFAAELQARVRCALWVSPLPSRASMRASWSAGVKAAEAAEQALFVVRGQDAAGPGGERGAPRLVAAAAGLKAKAWRAWPAGSAAGRR